MYERRQYRITGQFTKTCSFDEMQDHDVKPKEYEALEVGGRNDDHRRTVKCSIERLPDLPEDTQVPISKLTGLEVDLARASGMLVKQEGQHFVPITWLEKVRSIMYSYHNQDRRF